MAADHCDLERGEEVSFTTEDGAERTGVVCKANRGGVRVLSGDRLYVINNGVVKSVHPDGGALRHRSREGRLAGLERTGRERDVEYVQREGWVHA
jgi:hypothetical protein